MYIRVRGKRWHISGKDIHMIGKAAETILIVILTFWMMQWAVDYAYRFRRYEAYGGEWLLPVFSVWWLWTVWKVRNTVNRRRG